MLLAAVVLDDQQHRQLRSALLRSGTTRRSSTRRPARLTGGPRYNGIVLPGDGFEGDGGDAAVANDPAVLALFQASRAASRRRTTTSSSRASASRIS